jgi:hypothetical protein
MGGGTIYEGLPADTPAVPAGEAESPRGDEVPAG